MHAQTEADKVLGTNDLCGPQAAAASAAGQQGAAAAAAAAASQVTILLCSCINQTTSPAGPYPHCMKAL